MSSMLSMSGSDEFSDIFLYIIDDLFGIHSCLGFTVCFGFTVCLGLFSWLNIYLLNNVNKFKCTGRTF